MLMMNRLYTRPDAPGTSSSNVHKRRGTDGGAIHFLEGGGTADRKMVFEGRLSQVGLPPCISSALGLALQILCILYWTTSCSWF